MKKYFQIQVMLAAGGPSGFKWVLEGEKKANHGRLWVGGRWYGGCCLSPRIFEESSPRPPTLKESEEKKERKQGKEGKCGKEGKNMEKLAKCYLIPKF